MALFAPPKNDLYPMISFYMRLLLGRQLRRDVTGQFWIFAVFCFILSMRTCSEFLRRLRRKPRPEGRG